MVEENGAAAKEGEMKRLHEDIEQLADGLRMTMNGKSSAETRVEQLMEEVEDKVETIEHLQVQFVIQLVTANAIELRFLNAGRFARV